MMHSSDSVALFLADKVDTVEEHWFSQSDDCLWSIQSVVGIVVVCDCPGVWLM